MTSAGVGLDPGLGWSSDCGMCVARTEAGNETGSVARTWARATAGWGSELSLELELRSHPKVLGSGFGPNGFHLFSSSSMELPVSTIMCF